MNTRHDNADGPEDIDAAFAEIVAGLERDTPMSRWPDETASPDDAATSSSGETSAADAPAGPRDWSPHEEDEGHFEPPEPPPLPRPKPATLIGVVAIVAGVTLVALPGLTGQGGPVLLPIGLVLISGGIGWLLFRMRNGPPNDYDDGARL